MLSRIFYEDPTPSALFAALKLMSDNSPMFTLVEYGQDRPIYGIHIGSSENKTLLIGDGHAEAALLLLQFAEKLLYCLNTNHLLLDVDITRVLSRRSAVIIPCISPQAPCTSLSDAADYACDVLSSLSPQRLYIFSASNDFSLEYCNTSNTSRLMAGILASAYGCTSHSCTASMGSCSCPSFRILSKCTCGVSPYPRTEEVMLLSLML
ncbi:MAG: hypothetical protein IKV41_04200 [Oscillospiraceae bacterium]|nr:hypothetical protein [Oscillospiraceae bacterium]